MKPLDSPDEPWTPKEFAHFVYQPDKTDPNAKITAFSITIDFGTFTRKTTFSKKYGMYHTETAKKGKCLVRDRNEAPPTIFIDPKLSCECDE